VRLIILIILLMIPSASEASERVPYSEVGKVNYHGTVVEKTENAIVIKHPTGHLFIVSGGKIYWPEESGEFNYDIPLEVIEWENNQQT